MIEEKDMARSDFDRMVELNGYETFTEKQVSAYTGKVKSIIQKSEREDLSKEDKQDILLYNHNMQSLNKQVVLNNDMTRETVYYRDAEVEFSKSEEGDIEKARSGVYRDTPQNRKLGRVGQKFGGKKESEGKPKEDGNKGESGGIKELMGKADEIKKEYTSLKEKVKKDPSEANEAKLAAKEEQLKRISTLIRNKRADNVE